MPKRSRLIAYGFLTFLLGAVLFFPARVAYQWLAPPELQLSGIRGSVWHGGASEGSANGLYLRDLQWQFRPLRLLRAEISYAINSRLASGFVQADIAAGVSGAIVASNVTAAMPLGELQSLLGIPGLQGQLAAQFSELRIEDGLPVVVVGELKVAQLVLPFILREPLGDFSAEVLTQDDAIIASLQGLDALFDLAGSAQLAADRSYSVLGQIGVTPRTPASLQQYITYGLGAPDARGQHEFRLEGVL